ncbi:hypothetical protein JYT72_02145 [Crocinitomix catalasitica]|nr:hypothetical protein [Crocinitomix catalasitica]
MLKVIIIATATLFISQDAVAQVSDGYVAESEDFTTKSFLIIRSSKSYNRALKKAQLACNKLGLTLDLRNMYKDQRLNGLTSSEICECGAWHGYFPRGKDDDGNYISIEYSSRYPTFAEGYFIVIVSSGDRSDVESVFSKVREHYPDAYIKDEDVFLGCMH